jgi:N-acetyl-1-D-myo-inositol-2-amino-2-deoxy-alpha-D-glucopyranoside deacetylase
VPTAVRVLLHALAVAAGVAAGVLGSFVHALTVGGFPVGLVCGLALSAAVFVAAGLAAGSRSGAAAAAGGWFLPLLALSAPRPEGDLVVAGDAVGYLWLVGGTVVAGAAVAWPYGRSRGAAAPSGEAAGGR